MANELQDLQNAVRDQVRETVLKAIPAQTIDAITKQYFDSEFKELVKTELRTALKDRFHEEILKQSQTEWDRHGREVMRLVSHDVARSILDGLGEALVQRVMSSIRNSTY